MKTTIVIQDGRVTVQVDDHAPVVVKPQRLEQTTLPVDSTSPPRPLGSDGPGGLVSPAPPETSPPAAPRVVFTPKPDNRTCAECGDPMTGRPMIAKICGKDECKKARAKKQNEAARRKAGKAVGVGRGNRGPKAQTDWGTEVATPKPLHEDAPAAKTYTRSKCCEAKVEVAGGEDEPDEGGTRHYVCLACMNACDTYEYTPPFDDPWNCGACRIAGRLCQLHFKLEADGKKAPTIRHTA